MSLEIIGAGFGRTGTSSTQSALTTLGYSCYHMDEVLLNRNKSFKEKGKHLDFWLEVAERPAGSQHQWDEVFANYTATTDNPGCCVWRELMEAHPDAKILLTLHPKGAEAWYESTVSTIFRPKKGWKTKVILFFIPFYKRMQKMADLLIWQRSHKGTLGDKAAAIARYYEHIEEVRKLVPPERLLVFTVDQGWKPLCEFLGLDIPEIEFPNVNSRAETKKRVDTSNRVAYAILAAGAGVAAVIIYIVISLIL